MQRTGKPKGTRSPFKKLVSLWANLSVGQRGTIIIAIPVISLITMFSAWVWTRQQALVLNQNVDHTRAVIAHSNDLLTALVDSETAVRGYNLLQRSDFLEPYYEATGTYRSSLDHLNQLLVDDPDSLQQLNRIEDLANQRMAILRQRLVYLQESAPPEPGFPKSDELLIQGKAVMDAFRLAIDALQDDQQDLLTYYWHRLDRLRDLTTIVLWATVSISLLSCMGAVYLFRSLDYELQQGELRLRESKNLIEALTQNVVDGIVTLNADGVIELFNPAAAAMFGYELDELVNNDLSVLLEDPLPTEDNSESKTVKKGNQAVVGYTWQTMGLRKVGNPFPVEVSFSEIQLDNRSIVIIRDTTDRKQAEADLKSRANELARLNMVLAKTNAALADRNRELDQFAYVASHDLKAPLRAIANLSEWIEEDLSDQLPQENKYQMDLLRRRVHRMEALINGLLDYSRVGRSQVPTEKFNVGDLLVEIIDSLDPPDGFNIEIAPDMPTISAKRVQLRQVFANLISNAIKHHPNDDGHIHIWVEDQDKVYLFSVKDDGEGIAPEYHTKIFTIFQTLEARDKTENTGVGLSIVKKIVETEGGEVRLESSLGEGSTFQFTWPKVPSS